MSSGVLRKNISRSLVYLSLVLFVVFAIFPIFWLIVSSIKPMWELLDFPPTIIPRKPFFGFYKNVITMTPFLTMFANSVLVGVSAATIGVVSAVLASYSIARGNFRGKKVISRGILAAYMFPQIVMIIPLFVGLNKLGLTNTRIGLILTHVTFSFPFAMWLLIAYFKTISSEMEEAARIDGASNFQTFFLISMPLAVPGIATATIFSFNMSWSEFFYSFIIISDDMRKTLPTGLYSFIGGEYVQWGELLAMGVMVAVPSLMVFLLLQKYIVGGLTAGAVKG